MAILAQLVDDVVVHKFELTKAVLSLGRHPENDIVIDDSAISAHHARVLVRANPDFESHVEIFIEDLGSTNGTYVNGCKLTRTQQLHHDDVIRLAWNQFKLINAEEGRLGRTLHMVRE